MIKVIGIILNVLVGLILGMSTAIIGSWGFGFTREAVKSYKENKEMYKQSLRNKVARLVPGQ